MCDIWSKVEVYSVMLQTRRGNAVREKTWTNEERCHPHITYLCICIHGWSCKRSISMAFVVSIMT
jgi:hypothetical protein